MSGTPEYRLQVVTYRLHMHWKCTSGTYTWWKGQYTNTLAKLRKMLGFMQQRVPSALILDTQRTVVPRENQQQQQTNSVICKAFRCSPSRAVRWPEINNSWKQDTFLFLSLSLLGKHERIFNTPVINEDEIVAVISHKVKCWTWTNWQTDRQTDLTMLISSRPFPPPIPWREDGVTFT